jgi:hypothetical protein
MAQGEHRRVAPLPCLSRVMLRRECFGEGSKSQDPTRYNVSAPYSISFLFFPSGTFFQVRRSERDLEPSTYRPRSQRRVAKDSGIRANTFVRPSQQQGAKGNTASNAGEAGSSGWPEQTEHKREQCRAVDRVRPRCAKPCAQETTCPKEKRDDDSFRAWDRNGCVVYQMSGVHGYGAVERCEYEKAWECLHPPVHRSDEYDGR